MSSKNITNGTHSGRTISQKRGKAVNQKKKKKTTNNLSRKYKLDYRAINSDPHKKQKEE